MRTDYTDYNNLYNHMSSVIRQIQIVQNSGGLFQNTNLQSLQNRLSFSDVFNNAASGIEVPESMDAIFEEAAEKYDVPVNLLKAIGKAESNFDANAVSSAGAQGVMQLMPATSKAYGIEDPFDARSNIMGGAREISENLQRYDGNLDLALAAYNAGSGNVRKYGGVPPFKETRNYLVKVKKYMGMDITADQTVYSKKREYGNQQGIYGQQDALYLVELMKMQMQRRMFMSGRILSGDGMDSV